MIEDMEIKMRNLLQEVRISVHCDQMGFILCAGLLREDTRHRV